MYVDLTFLICCTRLLSRATCTGPSGKQSAKFMGISTLSSLFLSSNITPAVYNSLLCSLLPKSTSSHPTSVHVSHRDNRIFRPHHNNRQPRPLHEASDNRHSQHNDLSATLVAFFPIHVINGFAAAMEQVYSRKDEFPCPLHNSSMTRTHKSLLQSRRAERFS